MTPSHRIRARQPRGGGAAPTIDRARDAIAAHLEDAAHFPGGHAEMIARPRSERDIAMLLAAASRVLVIGAQSSLTGGATPDGGLVLSTDRLASIEHVDDGRVRVGAGVPLAALQEWLADTHRWYPPAPTFLGAFAGGVIATNAAGAATFKYGATRAWVDELTVVLACGHVLDLVRGQVRAHPRDGFEIACDCGTRFVKPCTYRQPDVVKCSAGYFAAPDMDLIDLLIGSEGTLGIVTSAVLRVLPEPPAMAMALVSTTAEATALRLAADVRAASQATWRTHDPHGLDVAAIEHIDRRCIMLLRDDDALDRCAVAIPEDADVLLFVHIELPSGSSPSSLYDEVARASTPDAPDTPIARLCRLLDRHGVLDRAELAMPGDRPRVEQFLALREAVPAGVNRRVGAAKRDVDARIEKTAADMVVPFDRVAEMMHIYREGFARRNLDSAIWGHISDGNLHPNVIPRSYDDVVAGKEAILEFGREAARLGGCPLAEHGVGRNATKQHLLRDLYGDRAIDEMRAIKRVFDPTWKLAPGVIFR